MISLRYGDRVEFEYVNSEHMQETRLVEFRALQHGTVEGHSGKWFLHGVCASRMAVRSFALNRIVGEPRLVSWPTTTAAAAAQQEGNAK